MKRYAGIKSNFDKDDIEIIKKDPRVIINWDCFYPYGVMNVYTKDDKPIQSILEELDTEYTKQKPMVMTVSTYSHTS